MSDDTKAAPSPWASMLYDVDAPYPITTQIPEGYELLGPRPPYPDVKVLENQIVHVRAFKYQVLLVDASDQRGERTERIRFGRLVAELEGDMGEVEVERFPLPAEAEEPKVNTARCGACMMPIPEGEAVIIGDEAYHPNCIVED
jgi:hypothetical protein